MQRFRGGLVFKAHTLLYHSTLGLRVIKKKKKQVRLATCFIGESSSERSTFSLGELVGESSRRRSEATEIDAGATRSGFAHLRESEFISEILFLKKVRASAHAKRWD